MAGLTMSGADFKAFTSAEWGPDWYWDDTVFVFRGEEVDDIDNAEVLDTESVTILSARIFKGQEPSSESIDGVRFARSWLKAQTMVRLLIEVPRDMLDEVQAHLKTMKGVKVI